MGMICPGNGHVWIFGHGSSGENFANHAEQAKLPHVVSWELTTETEEATSIRTSHTNGLKVKTCPDVNEFNVDLTVAIDPTDWVYAYILNDPEADKPLNPGDPRTCWMFLTWDQKFKDSHGSIGLVATSELNGNQNFNMDDYQGRDDGIYVHGTFNPPGVGVDNDSSDVSTSDFSFNVDKGPYLPRTQSAIVELPFNVNGEEDITGHEPA